MQSPCSDRGAGFPRSGANRLHGGMRRILPLIVCTILLPLGASAQEPSRADVAARQAGALFVASCVQFASNPAGLRGWAKKIGLPELPQPGQAGFLKGVPGMVYDASNPAGKYVVVSHDDGGCLVLAEAVNTVGLVRATEAALSQAAITAVLDGDRGDLANERMRHRTYHASAGSRSWTLVISHGPGQPDQAMLSAVSR